MKLLSSLLKQQNHTEADILNAGIKFAMEFGANWLQPIQSRLAKKFPELKSTELDSYNTICGEAMHFGHSLIYNGFAKSERLVKKITLRELDDEFKKGMRDKYVWISNSNLNSLLNQGMYYAQKDGWL